jgi:hypothetical protein
MAGVTLKLAEPELALLSVIVTVWFPPADVGTVKVAPVNVPVLVVVVVPLRVTDAPLNLAVIVLELPKPVPETVTVEPTLPLDILKEIAGDTAKFAETLLFGVAASWKVTVLFPAVKSVGTVNIEPEKEPVELVLVTPLSVNEEPPNVAESAELAAKPAPDTDTDEPGAPEEGVKETDGLILNVALAELALSAAEIVQEPAVTEGILKVVENEPDESAVAVVI